MSKQGLREHIKHHYFTDCDPVSGKLFWPDDFEDGEDGLGKGWLIKQYDDGSFWDAISQHEEWHRDIYESSTPDHTHPGLEEESRS